MCFYFQIIRTILPNLLIRIKDEIIDFFIACGENVSDNDVPNNLNENDDYQGFLFLI